jgi:hypothetical protein
VYVSLSVIRCKNNPLELESVGRRGQTKQREKYVPAVNKKMEHLLVTSKEFGFEINADTSKYMFTSSEQKVGQYSSH